MPEGESVKVAVRVRPFNQRELDRKARLVIKMNGKTTSIAHPDSKEEPKKFAFDYSYWSHDGFTVDGDGISVPDGGSNYASQRRVFEDLGQGVLDNAFQGYNCSLFAYGQTGSGKSYSMVGYGANKGIVPITCDELFKAMDSNKGDTQRYEVTFSMMEIYNEQVRDLLSKENPKGGLPVRQNPKLGLFYVPGLKKVPVGSYKEIEKRTDQGTANRTVASTNMNATSSRAHTVVTITFDQIIKQDGKETKKSSVINLVDLAGSERADSTGATGDRLKEGANINKSLSSLGNVISALADQSMGKKVMVPYRDSVLTKLLQNALGGNSKTVMIAALSPADINYDETLSTLRYADRAKKIKNNAVVNENPMDKLVRELREENERLKKMMEGGVAPGTAGLSKEDMDKMRKDMEEEIRAQLLANQEMMGSWESRLEASRKETDDIAPDTRMEKTSTPHLLNLNEDPMLSGVVFHLLKNDTTTIGRKDADPQPNVCLSGLSIVKKHAEISRSGDQFEIKPASTGAKIKVNGSPVTGTQTLENKDRVLFGSNHMYVFVDPTKAHPANLPEDVTWELAQKEIAQAKGFATGLGAGLSKDQQIAQEQVLEILPMVSEVNAVSEELDKQRTFEVVLLSTMAQDPSNSRERGTQVMVKMKNLLNGNTWLWERGKFMNRRYLMQELYQRFLDGEDLSKIKKEEDPFWEPTEDVLIGAANVFLQSLSYSLDFDDKLAVTDYKGQDEGTVVLNVSPVTDKGKPLPEDAFVDDPSELLNKPYAFKVTIRSAEINKARFSKGIHCKYTVYKDKDETVTPVIRDTLSPEFNFSKVFKFNKVDQDLLDYFDSSCITIKIYGIQEDIIDPKLNKLTTKELRQMEQMQKPGQGLKSTSFTIDSNDASAPQVKAELVLMTKRYERLLAKEARLQELCKQWDSKADQDKQYQPFYNAVSAVAYSSGTKLKTRVQILNKQQEQDEKKDKSSDDIVSVFAFGEEEIDVAYEAEKNGGLVGLDDLRKFYSDDIIHEYTGQKAAAKSNGEVKSKGKEQKGSRACLIM